MANKCRYIVQWVTDLEYEEKTAGWGLKMVRRDIPPFLFDTYAIKHGNIIGNIYENPELLKESDPT